MQNQKQNVVTVVSEGAVYTGVRTKLAFAWVYSHDVAPRIVIPSGKLTSYAEAFLQQANLSKEDKRACRRQLGKMSAKEVTALVGTLRRFRKTDSAVAL